MSTSGRDVSPPPFKRRRISLRSHSPKLALGVPSRPITELASGQLRIFSWNINGVTAFIEHYKQRRITTFLAPPSPSFDSTRPILPSLRECLKRWKYPQLVCLQEVKIKRNDNHTQDAVRQATKAPAGSHEWGYTPHFGLPRDRFNVKGFGGKVYGVCTLVRDDFMAAEEALIREFDWDLEGRVLAVELPKQSLIIFNVYAVNGTTNPYYDPVTGLVVGTRHDRKRMFHSDLQRACTVFLEKGWQTVIAGDLNIARGPEDGFPGRRNGADHVRNRADFENKFIKSKDQGGLGMKDSFRERHGGERKYTYRGRGCSWGVSADRVDLILVSGDMIGNAKPGGARNLLAEADVLDEEAERGPSDHVPLYVTLEL